MSSLRCLVNPVDRSIARNSELFQEGSKQTFSPSKLGGRIDSRKMGGAGGRAGTIGNLVESTSVTHLGLAYSVSNVLL